MLIPSYLDFPTVPENNRCGNSASCRPLVICGLNVAHILMQEKKAFTLAETVIKPCLDFAAKHVHGGDIAVSQVKKIPLSADTMTKRYLDVASNLKEQLLSKLTAAPCYGIRLDETTDGTNKTQIVVFVRFPDMPKKELTEHFLFCEPVGLDRLPQHCFKNWRLLGRRMAWIGRS